MNMVESLKRFGTISFGIEMMLEHIRADPSRPGTIEGGLWLSLVPDLYRPDVVELIGAVFERYRNQTMMTEETLSYFIHELHSEIIRSVEPR